MRVRPSNKESETMMNKDILLKRKELLLKQIKSTNNVIVKNIYRNQLQLINSKL